MQHYSSKSKKQLLDLNLQHQDKKDELGRLDQFLLRLVVYLLEIYSKLVRSKNTNTIKYTYTVDLVVPAGFELKNLVNIKTAKTLKIAI